MTLKGIRYLKDARSLAVVGYVATAVFLCFFCDGASSRFLVPLLLLLAIVPVSHASGARRGIVGVLIAAVVLALFLFPPVGSPAIRYVADWIVLVSFLLCASAAAYLSARARA